MGIERLIGWVVWLSGCVVVFVGVALGYEAYVPGAQKMALIVPLLFPGAVAAVGIALCGMAALIWLLCDIRAKGNPPSY